MLKTYKDWKGNLDDYLKIGDEVDEELKDYFINELPPRTQRGNLIQVGEAYDHVNERATYGTLRKINGHWIYRGNCYVGHSKNIKGDIEKTMEMLDQQRNDER